ncbi:serine protease [candidate division KSB1 bacterium]
MNKNILSTLLNAVTILLKRAASVLLFSVLAIGLNGGYLNCTSTLSGIDSEFVDYVYKRVVKVIAADIGSVGSGFIISPNGLILTNFHLLSAPAEKDGQLISLFTQQLLVRMPDGEMVRPSVVAGPGFKTDSRNEAYDFILLKVDRTDLPYISFGDSRKLQEGDYLRFSGYLYESEQLEVGDGEISDIFSAPNMGFQVGVAQVNNIDNGGLSGGPVLDNDLNVVGLMSMRDFSSIIEVETMDLDSENPAVSIVKKRSGTFGDMISQRTDVGYMILIEPVRQYLKELGAIQ